MIVTTLVTGGSPAVREAAILGALVPDTDTAIILEGIPATNGGFDIDSPRLHISRIAPGCLCCTGNLTMRVTLNRLLRGKPAYLFIGLASSSHIDQLRAFLSAPPYDNLLALTKDLHAECRSS